MEKYQKHSVYIPANDGIRLAADIFFPEGDNTTPRSIVFCMTPYRRSYYPNDQERAARDARERLIPRPKEEQNLVTLLDHLADGRVYEQLLSDGFIVAAVDVRGTGASEGVWPGAPGGDREVRDAHDCVAWFAQQHWCNGSVGMYGSSYMGETQFCAALGGHPALKAIMPVVAPFGDAFDSYFPGGLGLIGFLEDWYSGREERDMSTSIVPVGEDIDGSELRRILAKRAETNVYMDLDGTVDEMRFVTRDEARQDNLKLIKHYMTEDGHEAEPMIGFYKPLRDRDFPVYTVVGAHDIYTQDGIFWQENLGPSSRMLFAQADHKATSPVAGADNEALNWFRWQLRGEKTLLQAQPRVKVYLSDGDGGTHVTRIDQWPSHDKRQRLYCQHKLTYNRADSDSDSTSDNSPIHALKPEPPLEGTRFTRPTDETTTLGSSTRWLASGLSVAAADYDDLRNNDAKGLAFETAPVTQAIDLIGAPSVTLHCSSTVGDLAWIVYLTEVQPDGSSLYLTEGCLRSDLSAIGPAPFNIGGLPYHPCDSANRKPVAPGEVYPMAIACHPVARRILPGRRLRFVAIHTDTNNYLTPQIEAGAMVSITSSGESVSFIDLPIFAGAFV